MCIYIYSTVSVDGHWGGWSEWSTCSESCGFGVQNRSRACDSPKADNGGEICSSDGSSDTETLMCYEKGCPSKLVGNFDGNR